MRADGRRLVVVLIGVMLPQPVSQEADFRLVHNDRIGGERLELGMKSFAPNLFEQRNLLVQEAVDMANKFMGEFIAGFFREVVVVVVVIVIVRVSFGRVIDGIPRAQPISQRGHVLPQP